MGSGVGTAVGTLVGAGLGFALGPAGSVLGATALGAALGGAVGMGADSVLAPKPDIPKPPKMEYPTIEYPSLPPIQVLPSVIQPKSPDLPTAEEQAELAKRQRLRTARATGARGNVRTSSLGAPATGNVARKTLLGG